MSSGIHNSTPHIVVLGAGVTGLTNALLLCRKHPSYTITVLAAHMPGDYSSDYASPWAGATYDTFSPLGSRANTLEKHTWPYLADLAANHLDAGVHFMDTRYVLRTKDRGKGRYETMRESKSNHPWIEHWEGDQGDCGEGVDQVVWFKSVCINTAVYLPWMVSQCAERRVVFKRAVVDDIRNIENYLAPRAKVDLVVNCTGLGAKTLGGVMDSKMYPVRGQVAVVREEINSIYAASGLDGPEDDTTYGMMRALGGGTILGGCYQEHSEDGEVDLDMAERIMKRAVQMCPELLQGKTRDSDRGLSIVRHGVGLRPLRKGGLRIECEKMGTLEVVHCYGVGAAGYQQSYGYALETVALVEETL